MRKVVVNSSPLIALSGIHKLNILRELKQANIIETLKPFIKKLRKNHIYISDALAAICLKMVGENVS